MVDYSGSFPTIVYKQTTAPTAEAGAFWYKTDTTEFFYYDGTSWVEIPTGASATAILTAENALNILEIQAADTITPDTSAQIVNDVFTDSGGYNNTIDTGNTTATFDINKYENLLSGTLETFSNAGTNINVTLPQTTNLNCINQGYISGIYNLTQTGADSVYNVKIIQNSTEIYNKDHSITGTNQTWFSLNLSDYTSLLSSGSFTIVQTLVSGSQPKYRTLSTQYDGTNLTIPTQNTPLNLRFVPISIDNTIIQTNEQTLPSTPTKFIVFPFRESTAGTGNITADISFNSGTNYQTGVPINTETSITNTGTGLILKLNLNGTGAGNTAEAGGYGVLFW